MITAADTSAYEAATTGCVLVDRSERGKLALTGSDAKEFLTGQVTNDIVGLEPGTGCYAALLTAKGKMRGDLRVLDLGDELHLDCERVALQALFDQLRTTLIGRDVQLHKRTLQFGLFSLIGPRAAEVAGIESGAPEHTCRRDGSLVLAVTDAGVDVFAPAEEAEDVRARLLAAGATPAGEDVAEVLRVETGRPRYGIDLDETVIPQEAALNDRAVSFTKGCYVGQETVARLFYKGKPNRHLRALRLSAPVPSGTPLLLGEREVGRIGSSVVSPRHGAIALAIVRREAEPGAVLRAGDDGATATVFEPPF